jgi:hypothetical protein
MEAVPVKFVSRGFGETYRRDWWWVEPMIVFTVFGSFVVYATWAAFQNAHYTSARICLRSTRPRSGGPLITPCWDPSRTGGRRWHRSRLRC